MAYLPRANTPAGTAPTQGKHRRREHKPRARRHGLVGPISPQSSNLAPRPTRFAESWIKSTARSAPRRFRRSCGRFTTPLAASRGPVIASLSRPSLWLVATLAGFSRGEASGTSGSAIDQDRAVLNLKTAKALGLRPNHAAGQAGVARPWTVDKLFEIYPNKSIFPKHLAVISAN